VRNFPLLALALEVALLFGGMLHEWRAARRCGDDLKRQNNTLRFKVVRTLP
jgi:hypothetical protein